MTVAELIGELQKFPLDMEVFVYNQDFGPQAFREILEECGEHPSRDKPVTHRYLTIYGA